MPSTMARYAAVATALIASVQALDGITVPSTIKAGSTFEATFKNADSSNKYRVYLAAALAGVDGPTCYLQNSTSLTSPISLQIPAEAGPSADYYTLAIADLTTAPGATYSNRFNLTSGTGAYTAYEQHLGGAPFWDADALPCSSYACARKCAQASYPDNLSEQGAYATMKKCILGCPGVEATSESAPAHGSKVQGTVTAEEAVFTLKGGKKVTAVETTETKSSATATEAVVGGEKTLTLGGPAATVSGEVVSFGSQGVVVEGSTTVKFETALVTVSPTAASGSASGTASATSTSSGAAVRQEVIAGLAGVAGLAALVL